MWLCAERPLGEVLDGFGSPNLQASLPPPAWFGPVARSPKAPKHPEPKHPNTQSPRTPKAPKTPQTPQNPPNQTPDTRPAGGRRCRELDLGPCWALQPVRAAQSVRPQLEQSKLLPLVHGTELGRARVSWPEHQATQILNAKSKGSMFSCCCFDLCKKFRLDCCWAGSLDFDLVEIKGFSIKPATS